MAPIEDVQPNGKIWLLVILVSLVFAASLMYFGRNNPDLANMSQANISPKNNSRPARIYTVYYNGGVFSPTNIRVHAGDSVRFQNDDAQPLRVVGDRQDGIPELAGFDSIGDIPPQSSFTQTFNKAGTFGYHNYLNKDERGTVTVRP